MEQVRFIRGTAAQVAAVSLIENAFYYLTDAHELFMVMNGELVPLDNSVYWFDSSKETMLLPPQVKKRIAYDLNRETLYIAFNNMWQKVGRDASIYHGTLNL